VRVVIFQHLANDARAFVEGAIVQQAFTQHGVEDPPLDRFEPVAGVR
jgi:hypothetical protein